MKLLDILTFRAATSSGTSNLTDPAGWLTAALLGGRTTSGQHVTHDSAMTLSAYYACIRNIAEDTAKLPFKLMRPEGRGSVPVTESPVYALLYLEPNPDMGAFAFRALMQQWMCGWGNAYAEIVRGGDGVPIALWPIHPSRVVVKRADGSPMGALEYYVRNNNGTYVKLSASSVLHPAGLGSDGVSGYSVLAVSSESVGRALAVQKYGAAFFGNGALPSGILTHPGAIDEPTRRNMQRQWMEQYGGADNSNKVAVLSGDLKYQTVSIPPEQAQFLETSDHTVEDVARWHRMPLHKLQHNKRAQGWSTLDAHNSDYVTDCLMPWLVRWEQECARKLLSASERAQGYFFRHTVQALMRGDQRTRGDYYARLFNMGSLSPDDIRELEDMNPIGNPAGGKYYVQANVVPIENAGQATTGQARPASAPDAGSEPDTGARAAYFESMRPMYVQAAGRIVAKESAALKRATDKHADSPRALAAWARTFYAELRQDFTAALEPIVAAARLAGYAVDVGALGMHANAYCAVYESNPAEAGTTSAEALAVEWIAIMENEG